LTDKPLKEVEDKSEEKVEETEKLDDYVLARGKLKGSGILGSNSNFNRIIRQMETSSLTTCKVVKMSMSPLDCYHYSFI
jgi:hypothetical protein